MEPRKKQVSFFIGNFDMNVSLRPFISQKQLLLICVFALSDQDHANTEFKMIKIYSHNTILWRKSEKPQLLQRKRVRTKTVSANWKKL